MGQRLRLVSQSVIDCPIQKKKKKWDKMILFLCPISFYVPIFNNFFNFKLCIKKKKIVQFNLHSFR